MSVPSDASRRELLKVVGVGAAGAALVGTLARKEPIAVAPAAPPGVPGAPEVPTLFGDLVGKQLGRYRVESVGSVDRGGIPVVLATADGERFRVDVLRVDPSDGAAGIGFVGSVSVYLRNGGDGHTATDEQQGLGAMALAQELVRRERKGLRPPSELMTRGERDALDGARAT